MNAFWKLVLGSMMLVVLPTGFCAEPIITHDVHVMRNTTPQLCKSSWEGNVAPVEQVDVSGMGENDILSSPVIQSCSGCAYDATTHDCVCRSCYGFSDN